MGSLKKYYFGKSKSVPNTIIGGVSSTINTTALVASTIGIAENRIKGFRIDGNDIKFKVIGGSYTIKIGAFSSNTSLTKYEDLDGLVDVIEKEAFMGCTNAATYTFPNLTIIRSTVGTGTSPGIGTFRNNTSLVTFSAPKLTTISGTSTFRSNTSLVTFNCPLYTTNINTLYTFNSCSNLTNLTIGKLTSLGDSDFSNCSKITSIDLSELTTLTAGNQFNGCTLLANIVSINKLPSIPAGMFRSSGLTGSITANLATSIGSDAFYACPNVTSYSFPIATTLSENGSNAGSTTGTFRGNTSMTSFSAPELTTLSPGGFNTFNGASSAVSIYIPKLTSLGLDATDNRTFFNIKTGCNITVKSSLQTVNSGAPDGDLVYASGTRGATIIYV